MTQDSQSLLDSSDGDAEWSANQQDSWSSGGSDTETTDPEETPESDTDPVDDSADSNEKEFRTAPPNRTETTPDIIEQEAEAVTDPDGAEDTDDDIIVEPEDAPEYEDESEYHDLAVIQVNYTTRYLDGNTERAVIHVFCRDPDTGEPYQVNVRGFKPYFYVPRNEGRDIDTSRDIFAGKRNYDADNPDGFKSIRGTPLTQVTTHIPRTVGKIRDDYDHYEADVLFPDRFLIDKDITSGIRVPVDNETEGNVIEAKIHEVEPVDASAEPRIHNVDIEVEDRNGFPEAEDAEENILCITAHDSEDDEYVIWYYNSDTVEAEIPTEVEDYEFIGDNEEAPTVDIRECDSEEQMLAQYIAYVNSTEADLIVGWNVDDFDAQYLINRLEKLNERDTPDDETDYDLDPDRLSRVNEVWNGGWRGPNIKGRVVFDLLEAYKRTQFSELDSYRLEAVGQQELDIGKERFDGDIGDLWEQDPERLIEYNLRDVEICVELDEQLDIIDFWDEVKEFVGCRLQDAPIPGDAVDMYVLHKVNNEFVLPSKGTVEVGEDYEGGAVFDPITGIKENVTVLDLKSLYPMCMTTINASPETKIENPDEYDGETFKSPNGIHYKKDEDGIIREMVNELLGERDKKKELRSQHEPGDPMYELYDQQQGAVKVIMNSLYGTLGWDRFRLYDKDNAAAVTATGRGVIDFTEQVVEEMGGTVSYGDTDSVMLELKNLETNVEISDEVREEGPDWPDDQLRVLQAALDRSFEIEEHINERYNEYARENLNAEEHNFLIEFEKLYKRFLQAGKKKRYAGHIVWKEGKFVDKTDITGFEYKRSDIAAITKISQKKLIEMLVMGEDLDDVRDYLETLISDFQDGEYGVGKIGIPSGIGKDLDDYDTETAQVRGAKYANQLLGMNLGNGSKPKRVYLDRVHPDFYRNVAEAPVEDGGLGLSPQEDSTYREFKKDPDVICFIHDDQVPEEFEVAWEKMLDKTLKGPLSRVLKAVDITWEDVKSGQEQTGIGQFM
jgi:DNA polymerase I